MNREAAKINKFSQLNCLLSFYLYLSYDEGKKKKLNKNLTDPKS